MTQEAEQKAQEEEIPRYSMSPPIGKPRSIDEARRLRRANRFDETDGQG